MTDFDLKDFKRFILYRREDETGISGTGIVAEGVQFSTNKCVIAWLSETPSVEVYDTLEEMLHIHGHNGKTVVKWIDTPG
jgi:hypothetical protein